VVTRLTAAPEHLFAEDAVQGLAVAAGPAGLVLGRDVAGEPVRLRLFRPYPTRVALVGGGWAAQLLVFRLLALGTRVAVRAPQPQRWTALDETAGGVGDRVFAVRDDQPFELPADDMHPVLHLYDIGAGAAVPPRPALGPWHTQLTVLAKLTLTVSQPIAEADLVLLQQLGEPEAALAMASLGLSRETATLMQAMRDDMVAVVGGRADRYVWLGATSVEQRLFGPPQR
jgi:hypothetical protein